MKCSYCGAELFENAAFCMKCGVSVKQEISCQKCGTKLPADAAFCFKCGQAVKTEDSSETEDPFGFNDDEDYSETDQLDWLSEFNEENEETFEQEEDIPISGDSIVILLPESNSAQAFGQSLSGKSPTEIYALTVEAILRRYPEIIGQKETHFTTDYARASQYTGTTRETEINGRTVYIKTGFSTKDKWKGIEKICQLAEVSFCISEDDGDMTIPAMQTAASSVQKTTSAKKSQSEKTDAVFDYAELAAKYDAQPVHDDHYEYNYVYGGECLPGPGRYISQASDWMLHDKFCESNLVAYKGWYYYIKPLDNGREPVYGLFRRLISEKHRETLLIRLSTEDVQEDVYSCFVPYEKAFGIYRDMIYFRKDSAIHCMYLDSSNVQKLNIHRNELRLYSPYPIDGGLVHLNKRGDTLYFYNNMTGTDEKITTLTNILGTCGSKVFFFTGAKRTICLFDARNQSVMHITDWIPSLNKKNIIHINCRREIIYYTESSGKNFIPAHKARIYGVNFSGELVDIWEAPKLPAFEFDFYSGIVFNGEIYALKTVTLRNVLNTSEMTLQNYSVYLFSRSGEVRKIYQYKEGGLITGATTLNTVGNAIVLYLTTNPWDINRMRWSLIPATNTRCPEENYIILHDPASVE